jgi:hypothetical protein
MKTQNYYFGSLNNEIDRSHQLKKTLRETIARRKLTMKGKIICGAFLLLDKNNNIVGFCPLAACLYLKPHNYWAEYDFCSAIAQRLNLSKNEISDFILGFDGQEGTEITVWYLLGAEMRKELQPESNYPVLEA